MIDDIDQLVGTAVADVLGTMLNYKVEAVPVNLEAVSGGAHGETHVASSVGFIGRMSGVIFLYSSGSFARSMTSNLLGLPLQDVQGEEMVNDAMGELANMVVGHIKSRLCDRGVKCVLTIPSIIRGSHLSIEPVSSTERKVYSFHCDGHTLLVDALIKNGEPVAQAA